MNVFKVTFENGDTITTSMNADLADAKDYYLSQLFQFGDTDEHPEDLLIKAVKVEQL